MASKKKSDVSRRDVIKTTAAAAAASAFAGFSVPLVHAGENNMIQIALVGCGGRGTGRGCQRAATRRADPARRHGRRLRQSPHRQPQRTCGVNSTISVDVPEARRFVGFDGYRRAMDSLRAGDVVILATPPAFRWVHFTYAIEKRLNVFMEKPVAVDGPSTRRMFALGEAGGPA